MHIQMLSPKQILAADTVALMPMLLLMDMETLTHEQLLIQTVMVEVPILLQTQMLLLTALVPGQHQMQVHMLLENNSIVNENYISVC